MTHNHHLLSLLAALLALPTVGCFFVTPGPQEPLDPTQADVDHLCAVAAELEERRVEVLGEQAGALFATGETLFWLDFSTWDPTLHSDAGPGVDYAFPISQGGLWNVRASDELVVTAEDEYDGIRYRAFAVDGPETLVGEVVFDAPGDEQRWWAYAVDAGVVYVVTTGAETTLWAWVPGAEPTAVTTLESAGASVGEFWEFGVDGSRMAFVESGRVWVLDLSANQATWTGNPTQASGNVHLGHDGVLFDTAEGPMSYRFHDGSLQDIGAEIEASSYRFNDTYTSIHLYQGGLTRVGAHMIYEGSHGLFAYDLDTGAIAPLLLSPCGDVRVDYRDPVYQQGGFLYTTGLTSHSGAVGADGPVYRISTDGLLP